MIEKKITAIVKPTHDCNLSCKYCYVGENAEQGRMNQGTLENTIQQLASLPGIEKVHFIWHGGEPLLMGLDFYKEIAKIQDALKREGFSFSNGIQTNATLVSDEVLDFIHRRQDFRLGFSLDGPEEIHNQTRIYKGGQGSFHDVMKGMKKAAERNLQARAGRQVEGHGDCGAIVVLSRTNISHPEELYEFFKRERINMKANPLINSGRARKNLVELGIAPGQYGTFLIRLFDLWYNDPEFTIDIDPLSMIMGNLMTGKAIGCNYSGSCLSDFVSIGPQGDIYTCGRFDGESEYRLGNINEKNLLGVLTSDIRQRMVLARKEVQGRCSPCEYIKVCNSGCLHNAYTVRGSLRDKDPFCQDYRKIFAHILPILHEALAKAEVKNERNT